jgi:hypothetical protein
MRDPKTEAYLNRSKSKWEYKAKVDFDKIDLKHSAENPARLAAKIDEDRAIHYGLEMEAGVEFPAIVLLTPSDNGKFPYDVATGMHRIEGALCARKTGFDAYVVTEPDAYRREVIIRQLNTLEGRGVTVRESILQVIALHEKFPEKSLTALSKDWGLKFSAISAAWRAEAARKRALNAGYNLDRMRVGQTVATMLNTIHSDRVFTKVLELIQEHNPNATIIDELCKRLRSVRDENDAIGIVNQYREGEIEKAERTRARHGRVNTIPATKLIANARRFNNAVAKGLEHLYLSSLTTPATRTAVVTLEELIANAKRVLNEVERIEKLRNVDKDRNVA